MNAKELLDIDKMLEIEKRFKGPAEREKRLQAESSMRKRGKTERNFEMLNNFDHPKVAEDFSDSKFLK